MKHWIVITIGVTAVHFEVADESGYTVFSGSEPITGSEPADAARAGIRASFSATRWAANNGDIEGYELLG